MSTMSALPVVGRRVAVKCMPIQSRVTAQNHTRTTQLAGMHVLILKTVVKTPRENLFLSNIYEKELGIQNV